MAKEKDIKISKKDLAVEGLKAIQEIEKEIQLQNIVKDNKIEFKVKDKYYRLRKPNLSEQEELDTARRKRYLELVSDSSYLFKKQWIDVYSKKGIDIVKKEKKIHSIQYEIETLMLKLAKTAEPKTIDKLTSDIQKLREEQYQISMDVTDLLSYSIESQLTISVNSFATYLVLESKENKEWKRAFESYEKFEKADDNDLISKSFYYLNYLMYNEENYEPRNTKKTS